MNNFDRPALRKALRAKRRALTTLEKITAAHALADRIIRHPLFINSASIAAYTAHDNEIDPLEIVQAAWELKKSVYLSALHSEDSNSLIFRPWTPNTPLGPNKYGILEPVHENRGDACVAPTVDTVDLVLLPLVGFDARCNRLGVGAGYYDRTFAFLNQKPRPKKPILMGLAYEFQRVDTLPTEWWDVPLNGVMTENNFYKANI
ncbi:MAG: 5-formyltetrahydrofolate cyclo-ligase [Gammaproteobacteria bacterium]